MSKDIISYLSGIPNTYLTVFRFMKICMLLKVQVFSPEKVLRGIEILCIDDSAQLRLLTRSKLRRALAIA